MLDARTLEGQEMENSRKKYFVCYQDQENKVSFLIFEYGFHFLINNGSITHVNDRKAKLILSRIQNKMYKFIGCGCYRVSVFEDRF